MTGKGGRLANKCLFSTPPWLTRGQICPKASVLISCNYTLDEKQSQVDLGKRFQCSKSTISKIAKNKEAILRSGKDDEVNAVLYTWFVATRAQDAPTYNIGCARGESQSFCCVVKQA